MPAPLSATDCLTPGSWPAPVRPQLAQRRGVVPHADVAVDPVELVGGDVDPVAPGELQQEVLPLPSLRAPAHQALVLGDPVLDVHHEVPGLQLGRKLSRAIRQRRITPPGLGPAGDLNVREQEDAQGGIGPALTAARGRG